MSKKKLTKYYYQENKERLQKKARARKVFLKKKKKRRYNLVVNIRQIFKKMEKKAKLIECRKKYYKMRKNVFFMLIIKCLKKKVF